MEPLGASGSPNASARQTVFAPRSGGPFEGDSSVLPAELRERYVVERQVGRGVYGSVYVCRVRDPTNPDADSGSNGGPAVEPLRVAVKKVVLPSSRLKAVFGVDQQVVRELSALRSLSHANILSLKAFHFSMEPWQPQQRSEKALKPKELAGPSVRGGEDSASSKREDEKAHSRRRLRPTFYLISELCAGDLADLIAAHNRRFQLYVQGVSQAGVDAASRDVSSSAPLPGLPENQVQLIVYQLLQAVAHCHARGVLHRDIKPQNIFVQRELDAFGAWQWAVRLGDFGICAFSLNCDDTRTAEVVTLLYRPPELFLGYTDYGAAVDVWSTAAVAAELCLGSPLFGCSSELQLLARMQQVLGEEAARDIREMARRPMEIPVETSSSCFRRSGKASLEERLVDVFGRRLLSPSGVDFLYKLLQVKPERRPSALEALEHPWMREVLSRFPNADVYVQPATANAEPLPLHYLPVDALGPRHVFAPSLQERLSQSDSPAILPWEEAPLPVQRFGLSKEARAASALAASENRKEAPKNPSQGAAERPSCGKLRLRRDTAGRAGKFTLSAEFVARALAS